MTLPVRIFGALALVGALAACETPPEGVSGKQVQYNRAETVILKYIGEGLCLNCFNLYRTMKPSKAYAISTSGAFGYSNGQSSQSTANKNALANCKASNRDASKPCKLLMSGDRYVWR